MTDRELRLLLGNLVCAYWIYGAKGLNGHMTELIETPEFRAAFEKLRSVIADGSKETKEEIEAEQRGKNCE